MEEVAIIVFVALLIALYSFLMSKSIEAERLKRFREFLIDRYSKCD